MARFYYTPFNAYSSQAYVDALNERNRFEAENRPGAYSDSYSEALKNIANTIANRRFTYNPTTDPMYRAVKDLYIRYGKQASKDTLGQASDLTGGYASSYGQNIATQAYQNWLSKLQEQLPTFKSGALDTYNTEGDRLSAQYSMTKDASDDAYRRYTDKVSDYWKQLNYLTDAANRIYDDLYKTWNADQTLSLRQQQAEWNAQQDEINNYYKALAASRTGSSRSSGSSSGSKSSSKKDDNKVTAQQITIAKPPKR